MRFSSALFPLALFFVSLTANSRSNELDEWGIGATGGYIYLGARGDVPDFSTLSPYAVAVSGTIARGWRAYADFGWLHGSHAAAPGGFGGDVNGVVGGVDLQYQWHMTYSLHPLLGFGLMYQSLSYSKLYRTDRAGYVDRLFADKDRRGYGIRLSVSHPIAIGGHWRTFLRGFYNVSMDSTNNAPSNSGGASFVLEGVF